MNARVYVLENSDSASLGAAFRAKHALAKSLDSKLTFSDVVSDANLKLESEPNPRAVTIYEELAKRYRKLELSIVQ